jgi:hypothetical protein
LGVLAPNVYLLIGPIFNVRLWDIPLMDPVNLPLMGWGLFGISFLLLKSRRMQVAHAVIWGTVAAPLFFILSPAAY